MFFRAKGFFFPLISPLFLLTAFMAHGMMTENIFRRNFHHPRKDFIQHLRGILFISGFASSGSKQRHFGQHIFSSAFQAHTSGAWEHWI